MLILLWICFNNVTIFRFLRPPEQWKKFTILVLMGSLLITSLTVKWPIQLLVRSVFFYYQNDFAINYEKSSYIIYRVTTLYILYILYKMYIVSKKMYIFVHSFFTTKIVHFCTFFYKKKLYTFVHFFSQLKLVNWAV